MLELGKPIHTFDAAASPIATAAPDHRPAARRRASASRRSTTSTATLDPETLLIADARGPLGIAGVMGGAASEVCDGDDATSIVESAIFDPISIRRTAFRYALRSEASLRFEKGQEIRLARLGADRTARLIAEWAGGTVAPRRGRHRTRPSRTAARVAFRPARVNRLLGTTLADRRAARAPGARRDRDGAGAAGDPDDRASPPAPQPLEVEPAPAEALVAIVPTWRRDLAIEADIAEEVARVRGYEHVPAILPHTPMPPYRHPPLELRDRIRETLAGAGLTEAVTPRARRAARPSSGSPGGRRIARRRGRARRRRPPDPVTNPLSSRPLGPPPGARRQPRRDRLDERPARPRRRRDLRDRQGLRPRRRRSTREWWRLGIAPDRRRRAAGLEPTRRGRTTSTTRRALIELIAGGSASATPATTAA